MSGTYARLWRCCSGTRIGRQPVCLCREVGNFDQRREPLRVILSQWPFMLWPRYHWFDVCKTRIRMCDRAGMRTTQVLQRRFLSYADGLTIYARKASYSDTASIAASLCYWSSLNYGNGSRCVCQHECSDCF